MLRVPVLSQSGKPLMPTKPSRARRWLKEGKAKVVHNDLECFAIQLTVETGENTQPLRQWLGLAKDKKNKACAVPATHAVDGVTLAVFNFIQWREWHSDNAKHGDWYGDVRVTSAPLAVIRRPPISRRQLHLCVPSKGGVRRKYGGTLTRHGFRKGDKVIAEKAGKTYIGWCSGDTEKQFQLVTLTGSA